MLEKLDILGKPVQFRIQNYEKFRSSIGGILTIFLGGVFLFSFLYFGSDLYERKKPSYLTQNNRLEYSPQWNLTNANFFLGIRVEDENFTTVTDPRFFEIVHIYTRYEKQGGKDMKLIKQEKNFLSNKCNDTHMKSHMNMKKSDGTGGNAQDFSNFYCPDINHLIGGDFTGDFYGALSFNIKICDKDTESRLNLTCATELEKKHKYKNKFFVGKVTHNHIIDPSDYAIPVIQTFDYTVQQLETSFKKQTFISFAINNLKTDANIFASEWVEKKFLQIESEKFDFTLRGDDGFISESSIFMSRSTNNYLRTYIKLQEVFAIVGGFTGIIIRILSAIYALYLNSCYVQYIFSNLIKIGYKKNPMVMKNINAIDQLKTNKSSLNSHNVTRKSSCSTPSAFLNSSVNPKVVKKPKPVVRSNVPEFRYRLHNVLWDTLFMRRNRNGKGIRFFNDENVRILINKEISDKFDILNYFKILDQFSILKKILLNPSQEYMFSKMRLANFDDLVNKFNPDVNNVALVQYFKDAKRNNTFSKSDMYLFNKLEMDTQIIIQRKVDLLDAQMNIMEC
jgi:hypothetical protein